MASKGGAGKALRKIAKNAQTFPRKFVTESVAELRKAATASLRRDTGGDRILSRAAVKSRGHRTTPLTIKTSVKGDSIVTGIVAAGAPRSQWFWLEEGTDAHIVGGARKGALHPGTRGKQTWSRAATPTLDDVVRRARHLVTTIVRSR